MKQYVDLLELICASSSLPNTALLQDVNAIYAKLGGNGHLITVV
uniref:Uncharacterized protein n=1 Tax=Anguilla anguilla TaxID=7936 RepID=A0A0E9XNH8_ANGAN